jgi:hypothetical protein
MGKSYGKMTISICIIHKSKPNFEVSLTVRHSITSDNDQLDGKFFNTFITILYMYMFRAISCSSSGGQIVLIQHLVSSLTVSDRPVHRLRKNCSFSICAPECHLLRVTIPYAVLIQFALLRMRKILHKTRTCRGL